MMSSDVALPAIERAAAALYQDLPLDVMLITVRHPESSRITQIEQRRADVLAERAIVSQRVVLGGRQIGQIELQAGLGKAAHLMEAAEALQDAIAIALAA